MADPDDPVLAEIEARMSVLAAERKRALDEAKSLSTGLGGMIAGFRGTREKRLDAAVERARVTKEQLDALRADRERRIAELDPARAEEMALAVERQLLMERAEVLRKKGGPQAALLDRLEQERRTRLNAIEGFEHAVFVGERALKAVGAYQQRLTADGSRGQTATVGTAGAEARETLVHFYDKAGADAAEIDIARTADVEVHEEIARCARLVARIEELRQARQQDLERARVALRPIEAGYRNLLATVARQPV